MYIKALSKSEFINYLKNKNVTDENVEEYKSTYFISINEPEEPGEHYFKKEHPNVLTLYFHDCEDDDVYKHYLTGYNNETHKSIYKPIIFFNSEMAKQVLDILERAKKSNAKSLLVHCTAGISRSGAISVFARDFFDSPDQESFKKENPQIIPNRTVMIRLKKELEKRKGL